jgi:signal transduction histidine kinase
LLARRILRPLEKLRVASAQIAAGDLTARASESGPRELHEVSAAFNEMATNIEQLFDARSQLVAWGSHDLRTPIASLRAIRLEARTRGLPVPVRMAPEKVERVLLNLIANAVRHAPDGGTVSVVVEPHADRVPVAVEDTGNGITHLTGKRMFDLFWRDDESRTRSTGGAGVGLAVAQGVVRAHGGTIWAENRSSGGARVAFTLPRVR